MKEEKPNRKPDQIFVRKGLATPSPGTEQEREHLSLYQETVRRSPRPTPAEPVSDPGMTSPEDEVAPAGSLLAVDMRNHSGRAWIEAQNGDIASSDFSSLLLRQGNLPLDTPISSDESTAKVWKRLREEFGDEPKESEESVRPLPSWSAIKESLGKEEAPAKDRSAQEESGPPTPAQDDQIGQAPLLADSKPSERIDLIANAETLTDRELGPPAEPAFFAEKRDPKPAEQEPATRIEPPAAPPSPPPSREEPSRERPGFAGVALALVALAAVATGLWFQFAAAPDQAEPPSAAVRDEPQGAPAEVATAVPAPGSSPALSSDQTTAEESAAATPEPATALASADPAATEDSSEPIPPTAQNAEPPAAVPADASEPAPIEPRLDLVRIESDGQAVIAGRAEPFTDLIILDNGEPIGTARSNAEGEWAFIPDAPLPPGKHQIAMVVNTPQGEVILREPSQIAGTVDGPAPPTAADGEPEAAGDVAALDQAGSAREAATELGGLPTPRSKPADVARALPPYGVQLSSNTSRQSAEDVWQELKLRFPDLLGDKTLMIQEVELDQSGTRFRVQTGLFDDLASARKLCRAFAEREQECLVFKR